MHLNANENENEKEEVSWRDEKNEKDMRMRAKTFTEPKPINLQILFFDMGKSIFCTSFIPLERVLSAQRGESFMVAIAKFMDNNFI